MSQLRFPIAACLVLLASAAFAVAHEYKFGSLEIIHPHMPATAPGATVAGGYMKIRNSGADADRLIGISADFSAAAEIHEMKMDGDVMQMRPLPDGIEIPAGGQAVLEPGGFHIMFTKLKGRLTEGEMRKAKLTFEKAGEIEIEFVVEPIGGGDHAGHSAPSN